MQYNCYDRRIVVSKTNPYYILYCARFPVSIRPNERMEKEQRCTGEKESFNENVFFLMMTCRQGIRICILNVLNDSSKLIDGKKLKLFADTIKKM